MLYFIAAGVLLVVVALVRQLMREPLRRAAGRLPRRRGAGALPRLRPGQHQARGLRDRGGHGRASPGRCSSRSSASSRPTDVGVVPSIGLLIGVAIGGRTTLLGPVLGAIAVGVGAVRRSRRQFPSGWTYFQGVLFIAGHRCSCPAAWRRWAALERAARRSREPRRPSRRRSTRPRWPPDEPREPAATSVSGDVGMSRLPGGHAT